MEWVEANGAVFRTERVGGGPGTPLLLIHELGGDLESWGPALDQCICAARPGLRFDWRGAGMSEKIRGPFDIEVMTKDIAGVIDATGFGDGKPVDVIGIALGAGVAIALAARYPQKVRRLIATSPAIGGGGPGRERQLERAAGVEANGMRPYCEASHALSYAEHLRVDPAAYEWYRKKWIAQDPSSFANHNRMLANMDEHPNLAKVKAKTLIVGGVHDPLRTPAIVKEIAGQIPGAEYRELETGHFMHVQTPKLCADTATAFFDAA